MLEMVAALKAQGRGPQDVLDDLARKFGLYATSQLSVRVSDVALIADAMARLRADPPTVLGGRDVLRDATTWRRASTGCRPPTACGSP